MVPKIFEKGVAVVALPFSLNSQDRCKGLKADLKKFKE